jgi:ABC-2 type transport system ATP-binding protein
VVSPGRGGGGVVRRPPPHPGPPGGGRAPDRLPSDQHLVSASHTDRQSTLVVRADGPIHDPAWTVSQLGLEDLVLAYMERPQGLDVDGRNDRPAMEVVR